MRRIAVISASSVSGHACVDSLISKASGLTVRCCYRSADKAAAAAVAPQSSSSGRGNNTVVETMIGVDASDRTSLLEALAGADAAVLVTPLDHARGFSEDAQLSVNMCSAAVEAGVKRLVHVGSWTVKSPERLPGLSSRFLATEKYLMNEAPPELEWTVLRGGYFMNNLKLMFGAPLSKGGGGASSIAFPKVKVAPCDTRDIGEAAAALCTLSDEAFEAGSYHRRFLECSGPQELDFQAIAEKLSTGLGREIGYEEISVEAWCEGKPPPMQELLRFMSEEQGGAVPFAPADLTPLLGREPRSFDEWLQDHKAACVVK
jgi:uncharacterized protein YbjT (DUF2867 family)